MTVVTRFAPSPTGILHIGGARTALFNWLYARHHGGRFLLRLEDTDRARSTREAIDAIIDGLDWLGLEWDGDVVHQSARAGRHREIAEELLAEGKAYRCYCTPEELAEMRANARAEGKRKLYDGRWRDRDPSDAPPGAAPVIRFRAPQDGDTVIEDLVQGEVRVARETLDDMVLLRSDGTPTYMLSVVVDDHDMEISHVIRGDDHLTNAFRQAELYRALGWAEPLFAHIPLIHGADGAKLSKRHGALGVEAYREMGVLPEALCNTLLRLGWSHGDDEIIAREQAIEWFDLAHVGRGAARFDLDKLMSVNAHYLRRRDDATLAGLIAPLLAARLGRDLGGEEIGRLERGMASLKERAKTTVELAEVASFYAADRPLSLNPKALKILTAEARERLAALIGPLTAIEAWDGAALEALIRAFADEAGIKLGGIAQPLRAALTGSDASPGIFEVMEVLGRDECVGRLADVAGGPNA
ncbi:MAG: glutamate--tRNA ligase [Proteobacteria bacterium]|nr:glutamate--tRNA ligase [Pseudomonadota bacterium]